MSSRPKVHKDEGLWLLSFCDLSFILMSFFVLLLSWSTMDKAKVENVQDALKPIEKTKEQNLVSISRELESLVKKLRLEDQVKVNYDVDGLAVEMKDAMLFTSGTAAANPRAQKVTDTVLKIIAGAPNKYRLIFEGHTDDQPIKSLIYPSNWELSAARGISMMNMFAARGIQHDRMSVVAYAETRPVVKYAGLTGAALEKARSTNRRVVIRIQ